MGGRARSSGQLSGALMGGPLGEADFSGELTPNPGGSGTFDVTSGPFAGSTGSWTAERLLASIEIPTLTPLALTVLLLLIVVAGYALLRRRPVA